MLGRRVLPHSCCSLIGSSTGPLPLFVQGRSTHTHTLIPMQTWTYLHTETHTHTLKHTHTPSHKHSKTGRVVWPLLPRGQLFPEGLWNPPPPSWLGRRGYLKLSTMEKHLDFFTCRVCPSPRRVWCVNIVSPARAPSVQFSVWSRQNSPPTAVISNGDRQPVWTSPLICEKQILAVCIIAVSLIFFKKGGIAVLKRGETNIYCCQCQEYLRNTLLFLMWAFSGGRKAEAF